MIIAQKTDRKKLVSPPEATLLESERDTVTVVYYKSSVDRDTQMSHHKAVEKHNDEKLKHVW